MPPARQARPVRPAHREPHRCRLRGPKDGPGPARAGRGLADHAATASASPTPTTRSRPARAARSCWRTSTCARRSCTSTTSGSRSAWCTPAAPARTASSPPTAPPRRSPGPPCWPRRACETPVFVRFSTVLGSRGSADTVRDTRGFATKFYTKEGTWDLVGNNIPVFFIQDAIKFPDIIHAGKPHPDREIPQAQSAHDTFWDFVTLHTEATHHTIWNMSDRGIPRSYRMMEGFGVHTFRLVNAERETVAGQVPLEARARRALADLGGGADRRGRRPRLPPPRPRTTPSRPAPSPSGSSASRSSRTPPDETFEGIDLLDPTKIVPEELAPVQPIGKLVLNGEPDRTTSPRPSRSPSTPATSCPGIEFTNDPLLQGRNFSYLDTQITRLGGPNFTADPDQPAARAGQRQPPRRVPPAGHPHRRGPVHCPTRRRRQPRSPPTGPTAGTSTCLGPSRATWCARRRRRSTTTSARRRCSTRACRSVEKHARHRGLHLRARQGVREGDQGAGADGARQDRRRPVREGRRRARAAGAGRQAGRPPAALTRARPGDRPSRSRSPDAASACVAGPDADLPGIADLRKALEAEGAQLLVIAPHGGELGKARAQAGRRADQRHRPVGRVRRGRRRRRRTQGQRHQGRRPAAGGVPAAQAVRARGATARRCLPRRHRHRGDRACSPARAPRRSRPSSCPRWAGTRCGRVPTS